MPALRERICFEISKRLLRPPEARNEDMDQYASWRSEHLSRSWSRFDDAHVVGKDVIDFGSGVGNLTFFLAEKRPRKIIGVELVDRFVKSSNDQAAGTHFPEGTTVEFIKGSIDRMPLPDASADTIAAFDCLEHVMDPESVLHDWHRVLRPGGRVLIEWFPYRGPWGPHMESLIPIPWAHVLFPQRVLFRTAERIYDLDSYVPRTWDLDAEGRRLPNKWRAWTSFREQGYVNELNLAPFRRLAERVGFRFDRFEQHSFSSSASRKTLSSLLLRVPVLHEYFTSFVIVEIVRPNT